MIIIASGFANMQVQGREREKKKTTENPFLIHFVLRSAIPMAFDFLCCSFEEKLTLHKQFGVWCAHQPHTSAVYPISGAQNELECKLRIIVVCRINPRNVSFVVILTHFVV